MNGEREGGVRRRGQEWAPSSVTVPSGRKVSISYEDDVPAIEVKIQEMFGAERGPTIAGGSLPLQLQLMSPATRPAAVTQDLTSFWAQSYPAVRKDLVCAHALVVND